MRCTYKDLLFSASFEKRLTNICSNVILNYRKNKRSSLMVNSFLETGYTFSKEKT